MSAERHHGDSEFKPIVGKYAHMCPFFDGALIDEHDDRIFKCYCYWMRDFLDAQDRKAVEIDARR
jgi:hypothetical protein